MKKESNKIPSGTVRPPPPPSPSQIGVHHDCPLEAIHCTLAFATKDWSIDKSDAWIYGIVAGWDDASLDELRVKFRWTITDLDRLRKLHKSFNKLRT
jgi:hypothetical protein